MHDTPRPTGSPRAAERPRPRIAVIAAVARNRVIGVDNRLPWRLPDDMKRFRALTAGHSVIMGRRTWTSIATPLSGRQNIVVTRAETLTVQGIEIARSFEEALARVRLPEPAFVIGGEALYREALPCAELMYLTEIQADFEGDARFPEFDRSQWRETSRSARRTLDDGDGFAYYFAAYERQRE